MAADLDVFKTSFSNTYQELYQKRAVGKVVANFRFQDDLSYGVSVQRNILDVSGIRIRTITPNVDRTVDVMADTSETLTVDRIKGYTFRMSKYEIKQAGPLNAGVTAGGRVAKELSLYVDGDILFEVTNMTYDFDNGDLATLTSDATGITLSSTTVPQMVARMPSKNTYKNNQDNEGCIFVIDSYAAADIAQYLMGKSIDLAGYVFKNGFGGPLSNGAETYISEKLTSEAVLTNATSFSDAETVVIGGVTFTAKTVLGATPGNFLIGANVAASITNLTALINDPATTNSTQVALSAANIIIIQDVLRLTAVAAATTMTITGKGSGRLVLSETGATASWTKNLIHCYYGKKGFTDVVMQMETDMEEHEEPKQRTSNWMGDKFYGIKTFADGKVRGLDVLINA